RVTANEKLAAGKHTIKFHFQYEGPGYGKGGAGTLSGDGKEVAQGKNEGTIPARFSLDARKDVGMETGTPGVGGYVHKKPFTFRGDLKKVVVDLGKSGLAANDEKELKHAARRVAAVRE